MTTALITGGAGFIGSNLVHHLLEARPDWNLLVVDKLTYAGNLRNLEGVLESPRLTFAQSDIGDREAMGELFREHRPDLVVNLAAESHVDRSILDASPFIVTNVLGTQVLLESAREYGVQRFLQVSTDEVYGSASSGERFDEAAPLRPTSPYAASKAAGDLLCDAYRRTYGLPIIVTRSSNNYGPYQFPEKLLPLAILVLLRGEEVPVYGEGANMRDWLYVTDNCRGLLSVLEKGKVGEVYNIGTGQEHPNLEVIELLWDLFANRMSRPNDEGAPVKFVDDRPGHDLRYAMSMEKVNRDTGWSPSVGLQAGLRTTLDWYLDHRDWAEEVLSGDYLHYYEAVYERSWGRK
jgi:dTDP-glucose 4,6-dehydratase